MKRMLTVLTVLCACMAWVPAQAAFTETLPRDTFMLDTSFSYSRVDKGYDNDGEAQPLMQDIERYEPGGGLQGIIKPGAVAEYYIWINQLRYGILDELTLVLGIPLVVKNKVEPRLAWVEGDYQNPLGRPYSDVDFWQWADSMGQPKPASWSGNNWVLADIIIGARWRFSDYIPALKKAEVGLALTVMGAIPTGSNKDPEEITAAGTSSWDLHSMGEFGVHLSVDKFFKEDLDGHLTLGLDFFYEALFEHEYDTPTGEIHPLLLNLEPFVGKTYTIDPGDFMGVAFAVDVVPWKGPALATWLVKGDAAKAEALPPLFSINLRYTFTYLGQSEWTSNSELWDWEQEKFWRPGYKNILNGMLVVSLLRVGAPVQLYASYRNQSWIPGKNSRAADVISGGIRLLAKFW